MRTNKPLILFLVVALSLWLALPAVAADGGAVFKTKCAACHGPDGQGKVGPKLAGTSLSSGDISDLLTKGNDAKKPPHKKAMSSLSADDAKAVAEYVKTLK